MTKTVFVTGASRGIGLEFVRQYADDGWTVHASCRNPNNAADLRALKGDIVIHKLDVSDPGAVKKLAAAITDPIDVLIANAGVEGVEIGDFGSYDYDAWLDLLRVNLLGVVASCEYFAPHLKKAKGKIAAMSSYVGSITLASPGITAYRSSKAALNMAITLIAAELESSGIAAAPFQPGWVKTDMGGPNALTTPEQSISGLRRLIGEMKPAAKPKFLDFEGNELPW